MLQKLLICFFLIMFSSMQAQEREATLYFRDGTSITGYGNIKVKNKLLKVIEKGVILFKVEEKDKADEWDGEDVDKIVFHDDPEITFQYIPETDHNKIKYTLLQVISEGEVTLYASIDDRPENPYLDPSNYTQVPAGNGFSGKNINIGGTVYNVGKPQAGSSTYNVYEGEREFEPVYYVKRANETKLTSFIGSKKRIAVYFNDCAGIVKKLQTNEFSISTLQQIVEYYNDLCIDPENSGTDTSDDDK